MGVDNDKTIRDGYHLCADEAIGLRQEGVDNPCGGEHPAVVEFGIAYIYYGRVIKQCLTLWVFWL